MMNDYLEKIRKIDSVNPALAAKLFKSNELPVFTNTETRTTAVGGNVPQTFSSELGIAADRKKKAALDFLKAKK
jgi:hypothetical protein